MSQSKFTLNPYLSFHGKCKEALEYYARVLDGRVLSMFTYRGSPMEGGIPAEWHDKIMHGSIEFHGQVLMGSDNPPGHGEPGYKGISLSIVVADPAVADRVFASLAEGSRVDMPIQKTFWAERFGMLVDRYGVTWMVNCEPSGA